MRDLSIVPCRRAKVAPLRGLFLQELNAQCRYDAAHWRKGTHHYLVLRGSRAIGFGAVKDMHESPGTVFEFYLMPPFRREAPAILRDVVAASGAEALECQSNDLFYASLVRQFSSEPGSDTILFATGESNGLASPGAVVR